MIIVEGWVRVESADEIERLRSAAIETMRATKANEPGCLDYAYAIDLSDKTLLRIIERWTDEAALSAHRETEHVASFRQTIANAKIASALVKVYAGESVRTLMERSRGKLE